MSFALSSSNTSVTSRLLCLHHQHLLFHHQRPPRSQHEPVSIHKRTRSLEGVLGRLTDSLSPHTRIIKNPRAQGNLFANTPNHHHMEKVSNWCDILSGILQDQCIDSGDCYGIVEESCLAPWEGCREEFGNPPEHEIREYQECLRYYSKKKNWYRNSLEKFWFVSMVNDILWKSDDRNCITNGENVKDYA